MHICIYVLCPWLLSCVRLFVTTWTVAHQTPLSMGILQVRILEWIALPSSRGSSQPRDQTQVFCTAGGLFTIWATREVHMCVCVCMHIYIYIYTHTHTHSRILLSYKKERNNTISFNMGRPRPRDDTKWSESERDKCHVISLICRI